MRRALRILTVVFGLSLPIIAAPLLACGSSSSYEAGIPPSKGRNFLFYAETAAREMGYSASENQEHTSVTVQVPPDGSIYYVNDPEEGVIVTLRPESEPENQVDARMEKLRQVSDAIIAKARAKAKENEGF